jgi:23S rRNA (uridine2552-2'-O)-methyltransferase
MARGRSNPYARPDHRTRSAKAAGYPARSVFKLEEIDRRVRLLRGGQHVLDLGAAPGSWSKYVAERIGPSGRLLCVDLVPLAVPLPASARVLCGDVLLLGRETLAELAPYDVVLSDMAPHTSGSKSADSWRSCELFERALELAASTLKPGGSFVGKIFMGESFEQARAKTRAGFDEVRVIRPETTRTVSVEVFLVGLGARASQ